MGSGCWVLAPAPSRQPEFRNSNGHRLGEDDTATGNWSWELMLATGNNLAVQPVQHQLQLSLFLNGIIYTAVSQMPSAFSAMFTVVYFVVHLRRAQLISHGALPQFPLTLALTLTSVPSLAPKNNDSERSSSSSSITLQAMHNNV